MVTVCICLARGYYGRTTIRYMQGKGGNIIINTCFIIK